MPPIGRLLSNVAFSNLFIPAWIGSLWSGVNSFAGGSQFIKVVGFAAYPS
jgi:hypothetical protein